MVTTEVAILPLHPGSNPGDPNDPSAQILQTTADTLLQTDGCRGLHFGTQVESPDTLQMLINWDSIDSHKAFEKSGPYKPFLDRIGTILSGSANITHVDFQPDGALTRALSAQVTELATFYFDGEPPSGYAGGYSKANEWLEKEADGFVGMAMGFTHEDVEHEGTKGKCAVWAIGWNSVQAHMDFRQTPTFKENIHLLRDGTKGVEMHHVAMMPVIGSGGGSAQEEVLNPHKSV